MFKIRRYSYLENLISALVVCLLICFALLVRLVYLMDIAYNNYTTPPVEWEYIRHSEVSIPPIIEVENQITEIQPYILTEIVEPQVQSGKLTANLGVFQGPSGKETYYNLPMEGVIKIMRDAGYYYNYEIRDDGVKTYGGYVMVAADFNKYPRGTLVETSLGKGLVCDTGEFINTDVVIDIAVDW